MKFIKIILLAAVLIPCVSQAQNFQARNFITGDGANAGGQLSANAMFFTQTSTNTYGQTNTYVQRYVVTNSTTYPYVSSYSAVLVTNANGISDVTMYANRDGTAPIANVSVGVFGASSLATNIAKFKFATVPNGITAATEAQDLWSFSLTLTGTNILSTNVPTSFLQGNHRLRLQSVEWTNLGTNGFFSVYFNGFAPDGAE